MRRGLFVCLSLLVAGCGAERSEQGAPIVQRFEAAKRVRYPSAGLSLEVPMPAGHQRRRAPGVFRVVLGQPLVSGFAYRRKEPLPRRSAELRAARRRLVREVRRRGRGDFRLVSSRTLRVDGAPAIEIVGDQTLSRARLRTRSLHAFRGRAEYVIELLAPVRDYEQVNRLVFAPMVRSLELTGRIRR